MPAGDQYGVTFDNVKALLPHRRWTPGTKPDSTDVAAYIASRASLLGVYVDHLVPTDEEKATRLGVLAARAVTFGAAADTEAAGAPERARPNDTTSYADWLLEQWQEAFDLVIAYLEGDGIDPTPVEAAAGEPAWSFPEPVGWARRGI